MSTADLRDGQRIGGRDEARGRGGAGRGQGVTPAMQGHNAMGNRAGYNLVSGHHAFGSSSSMNGGLGLAVPPGAAAAPAGASGTQRLGAMNQALNQTLSQSLNQMNTQSLNQSLNYLLDGRTMGISPSQLQPVAGPRIAGGAAANVGSYSLGGAAGGSSLGRSGAGAGAQGAAGAGAGPGAGPGPGPAINGPTLNGNSRVVQMGQGGQLGPGRPGNSLLQQQGLSSTTYNPSGDILAMIQSRGAGMQVQAPTANGQLSSMGMPRDGGRADGHQFDINEFPQLSSRPTSAGGLQGAAAAVIRKQAVNALVQQNQEFSIQNEDFPALPGFKAGGGNDLSVDLKEQQQHDALVAIQQHYGQQLTRSGGFALGQSYMPQRQPQHQHQTVGSSVGGAPGSGVSANLSDLNQLHGVMSDAFQASHGLSTSYQSQIGGPPGGSGQQVSMPGLRSGSSSGLGVPYDQLVSQQYRHHQQQQQQQARAHQQPISSAGQSAREIVLNRFSAPAADDRFGLRGLLGVIKMGHDDLTTLALGTDLTTLGLNLNSRDNLYKTFASPWADGPIRGDPEYSLPQCYIQQAPPRLQPGVFRKAQQETLFYAFYSMPNDEAQLYAADELCNRGWFYHKELKKWFTRMPNTEVLAKTHQYERGHYCYFDPSKWETLNKENFVIYYDAIEARPQVMSQQPSTQR